MARSFNDSLGSTQRPTRWLTPAYVVDALGHFDLDPCGAPGHSLADRTYQIDDGEDGLELPWNGRVWLNPPYGSEAVPFLRRMAEHNHGTALTFARTETRMFFDYVWDKASAIFFFKSRIKFLQDDFSIGAAANAPSVLIAYGQEDADLLEACSLTGKFVRL